jgi:hypothetical protein
MWKSSKTPDEFLTFNEHTIIKLYVEIIKILDTFNEEVENSSRELNEEEKQVLTCCGIANLYYQNSVNVADLGEPPWASNDRIIDTAHNILFYINLLQLEHKGIVSRRNNEWTITSKFKNGKPRK